MAPADAWARTHDRRNRMITIDGFPVSYCPRFEPRYVRVGRDKYTDKVANALADCLVRLNATRERLGL